ncbi:MAG TPA: potassium channel family protein [Syntrophales bacterium]|nr:potassium channel family protein [Syntrophales bacterium]
MPENVQPDPGKKTGTGGPIPFREGVLRFSGVQFLTALLLLVVTGPFIDKFEYGILVESVLITLVLFSALLAIGGRRRALVLGTVLVIPALVGKWVNYFRPDLAPPEIFLGAGVLFTGYVVLHLFAFILRAPRVDREVLCTVVANYLMLGLLWSFAYAIVAGVNPDAFVVTYGDTTAGHVMKGANSMYFSFATLCTIGYGDIVPVSGIARMLAILEAVASMFYMTMLVARLVALYSTEPRPDEAGNSDAGNTKRKNE